MMIFFRYEWLHHLHRYSTHGKDFDQDNVHVCWAIALNIHLLALLKLCRVLNMDAQLSVQYLINEVGFSLYNRQLPRHCDAMISYFEQATRFLLEWGSVLLNVCPLTYDLQSTNSIDMFGGIHNSKRQWL